MVVVSKFLDARRRLLFFSAVFLRIQGEYYVPVRPNRGCFEAAIEVILKDSKFFHNIEAFRVL